MDAFKTHGRRYLMALVLGVLATAALYLPPFTLAARVDRALYDTWSRVGPPTAPDEIVLVRLEDPAWLTTLANMARVNHARTLITTVPQPPSLLANEWAYGPRELPLSNRLLRRTEWLNGGHLWFRPDVDGTVRQDWAVISDSTPIPSLALAAAHALLHAPSDHSDAAAPLAGATQRYKLDRSGRRWLRFYEPASFRELQPADLVADPTRLENKIVIAGVATSAYSTPLGAMPAPALLAQVLAGYWQGAAIRAGRLGDAVGWSLSLLLLLGLWIGRPENLAARWLVPACAAGGLVAASAAGFLAAGVWLPVAGPIALLLITSSIDASRPRRTAGREQQDSSKIMARRLAAADRLEEAWHMYVNIPPSGALLAELYELGRQFQEQERTEYAADVYHRIAQIDTRYRDVTGRLAALGRLASNTSAGVRLPGVLGNLPATLGRYELLEMIGHGSAGQVFLGRDPKINRIVAIKVVNLSIEYEPDELADASEEFKREVESAGRLNHPNIVTIFDVGEADGLAYIAMEYLKGRHLSDFTDSETLLPVPLVLELLARTADALHYAHEQNVVHRDIKPANIMYDSVSDGLKITDFGIARLIDVSRTRTGIVLGTPSFMAPEQLEGENVNGHTDLFALGVSLYQLLTGYLPFRGSSMTKLMFVIANEPHQPVTEIRTGLPEQLNSLIDVALAKEPRDRFGTGADMADALRAIAAQIV